MLLAALLALGAVQPALSQAPVPMTLYGPADAADSVVRILVDGISCTTADVAPDGSGGYLWQATIHAGECGARGGALITFTLDGRAASESVTWAEGGVPPDPVSGLRLTATGDDGGQGAQPARGGAAEDARQVSAESVAPPEVEVVVELRVWQLVDDEADIWVSARARGGDWRTLGTIPFPLEEGGYPDPRYRRGDLAVSGAALRLWRVRGDPGRVFACAGACEAPRRMHTLPLGMVELALDDGHSPGGWYRYGDLTIASSPDHPELEQDRARLLRVAETLAGEGALNWRIETPLAEWEGVVVGGTPPRVRSITLAGRGLSGTISGLLGELTALEGLELAGNSLTGAIPSKLGLLEGLTRLSLSGNPLTGCVPPPLLGAARSDLGALRLPDCLPPIEVSSGRQPLEGGTFLIDLPGEAPLIVDVPEGLRLVRGALTPIPSPAGLVSVLLLRHEDGRLAAVFDPATAREGPAVVDDREGPDPLVRRVIESAWLGAPEAPRMVRPALTVLASGSAGEVVLEWTTAPAGAVVWAYRVRRPGEPSWGRWTPVPGSHAATVRHRLTGLERGALHGFEVRPHPGHAGLAYPAAEATPLEEDEDGIARAIVGQPLEEGGLFRAGETRYTFRVPPGLPLALDAVWETAWGSTRIRWAEPRSGSSLTYDADWGTWARRHVVADGAPPGIEELFEQLVESIVDAHGAEVVAARRDVSGVVVGPDGEPVHRWRIDIDAFPVGSEGRRSLRVRASSEGVDGTFAFELADGTYALALATRCPPLRPLLGWYGGEDGFTTDYDAAAHVVVGGADVGGIVVRLPAEPSEIRPECATGPRRTVSGTVTDPDGAPLSGLRIVALDFTRWVEPDTGWVAADGAFALELPDSVYQLNVYEACGIWLGAYDVAHASFFEPPIFDSGALTDLHLVIDGEDVGGIEIVVPSGPLRALGATLDEWRSQVADRC